LHRHDNADKALAGLRISGMQRYWVEFIAPPPDVCLQALKNFWVVPAQHDSASGQNVQNVGKDQLPVAVQEALPGVEG